MGGSALRLTDGSGMRALDRACGATGTATSGGGGAGRAPRTTVSTLVAGGGGAAGSGSGTGTEGTCCRSMDGAVARRPAFGGAGVEGGGSSAGLVETGFGGAART